MLSSASPTRVTKPRHTHQRQHSSDQATHSSTMPNSPIKKRQPRGLEMSNPLGLQHLSQLLEQIPSATLETHTGPTQPQHILQGAQQQLPFQSGTTAYGIQPPQSSHFLSQSPIQPIHMYAQQQAMSQAYGLSPQQMSAFYPPMPQYAPTMLAPSMSPVARPVSSNMMLHIPQSTPMSSLMTPPHSGRTSKAVDCTPIPIAFNPMQSPMQYQQVYSPECGSTFDDAMSPYGSPCASPSRPSTGTSTHTTLSAFPHPRLEPHDHTHSVKLGHGLCDSLVGSPQLRTAISQDLSAVRIEANTCIEDTGISSATVQSYMSSQDPATNKWTCLYEDCGRTFGRKENIRSHVQTHLGDRQFKCKTCNKCFVRQHDLKRHAKIHSGDKPYKCPCGNGFARHDALTRHRQRGVCNGGLPGVVPREIKRGRPKKVRSESDPTDDSDAEDGRAIMSRSASGSEAYQSGHDDARSPFTPEPESDHDAPSDTDSPMRALQMYCISASPERNVTKARQQSPGRKQSQMTCGGVSPKTNIPASTPRFPGYKADLAVSVDDALTSVPETTTIEWMGGSSQPSLCTDAFSPPAVSSSALSDMEEDDSFMRDAFGIYSKPMQYDAIGDCSSVLDFGASINQTQSPLDLWLSS